MKYLTIAAVLTGVVLISACSQTTPDLVARLSKLQIPVVRPVAVNDNTGRSRATSLYTKNVAGINKLTALLKQQYLSNANRKDIFDVHSLSHQVYISLTNLEEAGLINEQYYNENNTPGLIKLHEMLQPYAKVTG